MRQQYCWGLRGATARTFDFYMDSNPDLERLRQAIQADPALHERLGRFRDRESFSQETLAVAAELGISLPADTFLSMMQSDPLGTSRWMDVPLTSQRPPAGWLPIQVTAAPQFPVDWAWFGDAPLGEPFFEMSIRMAMGRPLNRFCRFRTPLLDLIEQAKTVPVQEPSGFIFHMSRCGSTLAARMLAADPANVVISEAAPFDGVLQLPRSTAVPDDIHIALLRAMIGVLGQRRAPGQERLIVKLDSWHARQLPLFARAFPNVPWVFMYREPIEVMASQVVEPGMQTLAGFMPPQVYGMTEEDALLPAHEYCARVLAQTCATALENKGGLLVNYRELPEALWTRILPHFGIAETPQMRAAMLAVTPHNAKSPGIPFFRQETKLEAIDDALRALTDKHLRAVYAALEARRLGSG
jgi:hypothetical protein